MTRKESDIKRIKMEMKEEAIIAKIKYIRRYFNALPEILDYAHLDEGELKGIKECLNDAINDISDMDIQKEIDKKSEEKDRKEAEKEIWF